MPQANASEVCRVTLGCSRVYSGSGDFHPSASNANELCVVEGSDPAVPHHSLIARTATTNRLFDEYIIFHSDLTYPEYLVAYQRRLAAPTSGAQGSP
ncbi:hypothetical protein T484DRAFT_1841189 [Baffinella frigidus]|nr:hypothetical protein T484DRAFT_1841189 [Cryptophyta sp. CCMP2293]